MGQSAPSNLTSDAGLLCFICCRARRTWRRQQEKSQGTHRRQADGRGAWPQGFSDASIRSYVSRGRRAWAPGQGFPGMNKSALSPWELPLSLGQAGRGQLAGRGSWALQCQGPACSRDAHSPKRVSHDIREPAMPAGLRMAREFLGRPGPRMAPDRARRGHQEALCRLHFRSLCQALAPEDAPWAGPSPVHTGLRCTVPEGRL